MLQRQDAADEAALGALSSRWRDHVRELEKRGWVRRLQVTPPAAPRVAVAASAGPEPTPEQRDAISAIADAAGYAVSFATGFALSLVGCVALVRALDRRQGPTRLQPVWISKGDSKGDASL